MFKKCLFTVTIVTLLHVNHKACEVYENNHWEALPIELKKYIFLFVIGQSLIDTMKHTKVLENLSLINKDSFFIINDLVPEENKTIEQLLQNFQDQIQSQNSTYFTERVIALLSRTTSSSNTVKLAAQWPTLGTLRWLGRNKSSHHYYDCFQWLHETIHSETLQPTQNKLIQYVMSLTKDNINAQGPDGWSLLHSASFFGHTLLVKKLRTCIHAIT